jgi:hypothetical protein
VTCPREFRTSLGSVTKGIVRHECRARHLLTYGRAARQLPFAASLEVRQEIARIRSSAVFAILALWSEVVGSLRQQEP